jgi:hypothetical protein
MTSIIARDGTRQEINLTLEDHQAADAAGMSFSAYINNKYDTDAEKYGTAFNQALASNNIFMKPNKDYGIKAPTVSQIVAGNYDINMGAITKTDGRDPFSPQGRLIFAASMLEIINSQLMESNGSYSATFNRLVAMNTSVDSPRFDTPIINTTAPMTSRSQPIAQMAAPSSMVNITLSSISQRVGSRSIGLEISDEAAKSVTIDLVGAAVRAQAEAERAANVDMALYDLVMGNADQGTTALTALALGNGAGQIAGGSTTGGTFTHESYIRFLRSAWRKLNIDWIVCDLSTYLILESRSGRPNYQNVNGTDGHLNSMMALANPSIPDSVNYFIVEPDMMHEVGPTFAGYGSASHPLGGTRKVLGIDSTKAIRKVTYSGAAYSAIESFVLRRSSAMRWDYSESFYRMNASGEGFRLLQI